MRKIYKLEDLECAHCASLMETAIKKLDGVQNASVNFLTQKMMLECDPALLEDILAQSAKIIKKIEPDCRILL